MRSLAVVSQRHVWPARLAWQLYAARELLKLMILYPQELPEDALLSSDSFPPLSDQVLFACTVADLIRHANKQR